MLTALARHGLKGIAFDLPGKHFFQEDAFKAIAAAVAALTNRSRRPAVLGFRHCRSMDCGVDGQLITKRLEFWRLVQQSPGQCP